ncbi:MAG: polysaccharide pyruvyl transferase family protein [Lentisphaerae bacterium]|nr:polysaccharide pyruvyl transferase family protein [Lentisphaerota bacterium]MCP4103409.1 polysaccharide pyruvyl transferase family protein [Lentisphaerota bacterium]
MLIQIDHTGFVNKGAELMLSATVSRLRSQLPNAEFIFGLGKARLKDFARYGLHHGVKLPELVIKSIDSFYPVQKLKKYCFLPTKHPQAVLDAGGFRLGDKQLRNQKSYSLRLLERYYKKIRKNQGKIIFLPQAYGPFDNDFSQKVISIIADAADIMFARDEYSYVNLMKAVDDSSKIRIAPDFTITAHENDFPMWSLPQNQNKLVIVPNSKTYLYHPRYPYQPCRNVF